MALAAAVTWIVGAFLSGVMVTDGHTKFDLHSIEIAQLLLLTRSILLALPPRNQWYSSR
jgi:hypothetical protein